MTDATIKVTDEITPEAAEAETPDTDAVNENPDSTASDTSTAVDNTDTEEKKDALYKLISITKKIKGEIDKALESKDFKTVFNIAYQSMESTGSSLQDIAGIDLLDDRLLALDKNPQEFIKTFVNTAKKDLKAQAENNQQAAEDADAAKAPQTSGGFSLFGGASKGTIAGLLSSPHKNITNNLQSIFRDAYQLEQAVGSHTTGNDRNRDKIEQLVKKIGKNMETASNNSVTNKTEGKLHNKEEKVVIKRLNKAIKTKLTHAEKGMESHSDLNKAQENLQKIIKSIIEMITLLFGGGKKKNTQPALAA